MGQFSRTWAERCVGAVDHFAGAVLAACLVAAVWFGLFPPEYPSSETPVHMLGFYAPVLVVLLAVVAWARMRVHGRSLCTICATAAPLNPTADAERRWLRFTVAHRAAEPRFLVPYVALLIASNFMLTMPARIGWALMQLTIIYVCLADVTHSRLRTWCPGCAHLVEVPPAG